jgi:hypothetical protein
MKGMRFDAVSSLHLTVMTQLKVIREEASSWAFNLLYACYRHCAKTGGDCIK